MALVLLFELVDFVIYLVKRAYLVERQAYYTALFGDCLQDALPYPPYGVRNEFETARFIELLGSLDKTNITFVNQVCQCQSLMLVLLCH